MRFFPVALIAFASSVHAQQQIIVSPPPMVVGANQGTMLLTGTRVPLRTLEPITTQGKKLKVGDRFNLEVSEPITLNGVTIIPTGSLAVGEITEVRNKGMFGKSGYVQGRILYVRANNRQIRLTGRLDDKGSNNGGAAGVATYATLVGGLFITGTSAVIPAGTMVTAYLDEDMPVAFAPGVQSSQPMVVPSK
ncbi:hypothetical protein [Sphingomonas hankookensis]